MIRRALCRLSELLLGMTYDVYANFSRRSVENLHLQLKLTGNFEPQSKHLNAICHPIYLHNTISYKSRVRTLGL